MRSERISNERQADGGGHNRSLMLLRYPADMLVAAASADRPGKHVYATLDGIRGIAAALIAIRHAGPLFPGWDFPNSPLAVDLFFVISGFVIASAYDRRLADGLSPAGFMKARLIRLYPLYLAGLLLGLGAGTLCWLSGTDPRLSATALVLPLLFGLVMLPSPFTWNDETFPLNTPSWSLFFELAINVVYAVLHRSVTTRRLVAVVCVAGSILAAMTLSGKALDEGHSWAFFGTGFVRVTYSFAMGLLLFRLRGRISVSSPGSVAVLALAALTLTMPPLGAWYPFVCITVWLPALVCLAIAGEPGPAMRRACHLLGAASYPLYVLHSPAAVMTEAMLARIGITHPGALTGLAFLIAMMAIALLADRYFTSWFGGRKPAPGDPVGEEVPRMDRQEPLRESRSDPDPAGDMIACEPDGRVAGFSLRSS